MTQDQLKAGFVRGLILTLLAAICLSPAMASAQTPTDKPVRLFAEGEDFTPVSGDWGVVPYRENYFASTFALTFLSRMAALGAPEQTDADQPAIAEQVVRVPSAGNYEVLARYEQPYDFSVEFTVEVEQNGRVVYSKTYGRLEDEKIWGCMGTPENRRTPMARFFWGATDNIVWQHFEAVALDAGEATIRLIAGPQMDGDQPRRNAARRHVDLIVLTNDVAGREAQKNFHGSRTYLEMDGWLVQDGDLYVRFRNDRDRNAEGTDRAITLNPVPGGGLHSPYAVHLRDWPSLRVYRNGYVEGRRVRNDLVELAYQNAGPRTDAVDAQRIAPMLSEEESAQPLAPGQRSGWVPMGHLIDALHVCKWRIDLDHPMRVEFAVPNGRGSLRTVRTIDLPAGATTFEMPGVVAPNPTLHRHLRRAGRPSVIQTVDERMAWLIEQVKAFPEKGSRPDRFLIYKLMGWGGANRADGKELALLLGDNTTYDQGNKRGIITHWRNPDPAVLAQQIEKHANFDDVYIVSYGDEHHVPRQKPSDEDFAAFMKEHASYYSGPVTWTNQVDDPMYYHSQLAAFHQGAKRFIAGTSFLAERGVRTGVNYSPHGNYLVTELDYIRAFKVGALSMPWSEDYVWQVPEFSVQVMGYLTSAFRAGAKYDNQPIHMYVMPHSPGNTPRSFRLSFYTAVANGATMINYFCASPLAVAGTENYVATDDLGMWRAIHDVTHEAGAFEDHVMDGQVRPARVGLVLSAVDDLRGQVSNSRLAFHNNERKAIYYALRHAQVPVDMLSEDDVVDGLADDYDVIYLTQRWAHSRFIKALQGWVERGGTVVALGGGGMRDEFNRANPETLALFGLQSQDLAEDPKLLDVIQQRNTTFLSKQDLPRYDPFDTVTWPHGDGQVEADVMIWKQKLDVKDARVLGTFGDGSPAVVEKRHGKGRAVLFGFLPGQAYLKSGLPLRPADRGSTDDAYTHYLPTTMDRDLRGALVDAFLPEGFTRPVTTSVDLIETAAIDTVEGDRQTRLAAPLINFTGKPIDKLTVRIADVPGPVRSLRSVEQGQLNHTMDDGDLIVELPLDMTDMLLIDF